MSENLSPPAPITIKQWLFSATTTLKEANIHSARLDALILLEDELQRERSWLLAHDDTELTDGQTRKLDARIKKRTMHIPLAYIRGWIDFYGRHFAVSPSVLIPRPETEEMIDLIKDLPDLPQDGDYPPLLIDVGTGSGCIGITARLERPELEVWLTDISEDALVVARRNFRSLKAELGLSSKFKLQYYAGDLLQAREVPNTASIIAANLPYVATGFEISPDAKAEPDLALFANDEGYELIERLLPQAAAVLLSGGYLVLESDPWQQERIIKSAATVGLSLAQQRRFHLVLQKA
jgi:release factor glutamine methyltransferase